MPQGTMGLRPCTSNTTFGLRSAGPVLVNEPQRGLRLREPCAEAQTAESDQLRVQGSGVRAASRKRQRPNWGQLGVQVWILFFVRIKKERKRSL